MAEESMFMQEKALFASALVKEAADKGLLMRVFGGLAFWMLCVNMRDYFPYDSVRKGDIDLYHPGSQLCAVQWFLSSQRFSVETQASGPMSKIRAMRDGYATEVFTGPFRFSHSLRFAAQRLTRVTPTLPVTELLLSKLQIHDFTDVDAQDVVMLLAEDSSSLIPDRVDRAFLMRHVMNDWGLMKDVLSNLDSSARIIREYTHLPQNAAIRAGAHIDLLRDAVISCRKTCLWHLRGSLGVKRAWYLPVD